MVSCLLLLTSAQRVIPCSLIFPAQTMVEAEELAKKSKSAAVSMRDLDQTTLYNKEVAKITDQLLDLSHSMQFQSQLVNKTAV